MRSLPSSIRPAARGWLLPVAGTLALTAAMAGSAAWQAIAAHPTSSAVDPRPAGYEADDHFPGAAALYLADAPAARPGTTGTIALPPLPVSAAKADALVAAESGIVPARPFSFGSATRPDRGRALQCLTDAVYYEAASEPDPGQRAVAQVVLNRVRHPAFPATICGVVYQGSEAHGCQFSFACDGAMTRLPSRVGWARAARVAAAALAGYVFAPVGLATHYHTFAVTPAWNRTLVMTDVVGAHFFHRWKGYWGTAAAFTQVYRGSEPLPGPHAPVTGSAVPALAPVMPAPIPGRSPAAPVALQLSDQATSATAPSAAPDDHLPPASPVLDRWRDSGKPL